MKHKKIQWQCRQCDQLIESVRDGQVICSYCHFCFNNYKDEIWDVMPDFVPDGFSEERCEHLMKLEDSHFWFKARIELLSLYLTNFLSEQPKSIIELGVGSGHFLHVLQQETVNAVGVDGHLKFLQLAKRHNPELSLIHCDATKLPIADNQFDLVVALDVLEHVEATVFLNEAHRLVKPGGFFLITVPAFQFLWSSVDEAAGHRCRYSIKSLDKELKDSGWRIKQYSYYQFFLFPILFLSRRLNRNKQPKLEQMPPPWLNNIFSAINHLEVKFLHRVQLPFGSSLIVLAQKL